MSTDQVKENIKNFPKAREGFRKLMREKPNLLTEAQMQYHFKQNPKYEAAIQFIAMHEMTISLKELDREIQKNNLEAYFTCISGGGETCLCKYHRLYQLTQMNAKIAFDALDLNTVIRAFVDNLGKVPRYDSASFDDVSALKDNLVALNKQYNQERCRILSHQPTRLNCMPK